jgi:hypothetical protein
MNIPKNENDMIVRVQLLEERVSYLESLILKMSDSKNQIHEQSQYDIDEVRNNITITSTHLSQILETTMEDQIISIIIEENKKKSFMKMTKHLFMYKNQLGWVYMDDSDLKLLIETIEHKILLFHSKSGQDAETHFDNNKIIYGLNLSVRFKKIKIKLIDTIQ